MIRPARSRRAFWSLGLALAAALLPAQPAWAQRAEARWTAAWQAPSTVDSVRLLTRPIVTPDSAVIPRTYWLEGAGILGGVSALAGAYLGVQVCQYVDDCTRPTLAALGTAALMAVVGFGIGALIGGQFPKT